MRVRMCEKAHDMLRLRRWHWAEYLDFVGLDLTAAGPPFLDSFSALTFYTCDSNSQ